MRTRIGVVSLATATLVLASAIGAGATTTLDETIQVRGKGAFKSLKSGPGEPFIVREAGLGKAKKGRQKTRRSLAYFSQLTDPQIADEMSPLRVELVDPAGGEISAAWRPQEAMGTQVLDQIVRVGQRQHPLAGSPGREPRARQARLLPAHRRSARQPAAERGRVAPAGDGRRHGVAVLGHPRHDLELRRPLPAAGRRDQRRRRQPRLHRRAGLQRLPRPAGRAVPGLLGSGGARGRRSLRVLPRSTRA